MIALIFLASCSNIKAPLNPNTSKDFSQGEVILATQLLTKIFDQEMAPIQCVPDIDEAALLLRTINPRMEIIQDDIEASLDDPKEIKKMIESCEKSCTCDFIDDLLREHLVVLDKELRKSLEKREKQKDLKSCLNFAKETFCSGDLYKQLEREKVDFSYEEENP